MLVRAPAIEETCPSGVQPSEDAVTERPLTDPRAEALARAIIATVDKLTYDGLSARPAKS
ncbi:hypothetical protein [Mesorhizobium sp. Cs1321R2N1]|uniref:hypothetical protein n=1 Tax=Mesorhizobium sp. Cs1321R2N1 TaxID=3015174 RepID=UPI00301E1E03